MGTENDCERSNFPDLVFEQVETPASITDADGQLKANIASFPQDSRTQVIHYAPSHPRHAADQVL